MGASSYLDRFTRALPSVQGNQILRLLISKKDSGEIKTLDEFKNQLKTLTTALIAQKLKPTLKLWPAIAGQDISSEQYNDMLLRISNDLESGFAEANNLDEVITAHHQLINNVSLKMLRYGLNKLDEQVSLYEFLQNDKHGFDNCLFDTFRTSENMATTRSDPGASQLFYDPHTLTFLDSDYDSVVDAIGERLMMGCERQVYLTIRSAKHLAGSDSVRSELDVSFANSNINNIIDGKDNTYWATSVLLSNVRSTGAKVEIEFRLAASQDVNFVEIEPVGYYPLRLAYVKYYDGNQVLQTAQAPDLLLYGPARINFNRITTSRLILSFVQESYDEVQFKKRENETNFYRALLGGNTPRPDMASAKAGLEATVTSSFLLGEVFSLPPDFEDFRKYYEYIIGFDNIRIGFSSFLDRSIYVSKKKTVSQPNVVALRVDEYRPLQSNTSLTITPTQFLYPAQTTTEDNNFYHGVIEYWLLVQSYTSNNVLISTDYLPILPLNASRVYHEQLVFTERSSASYVNKNVACLVNYTLANSGDVILYKNGTRLTHLTDWAFSNTFSQTDPDGTSRMVRAVSVVADPNILDIYTVSYTPVVSNTLVQPNNTDLCNVVGLTEESHIRVTKDNVITFEQIRDSFVVDHADMYLIVIMRRNSANMNVCPVLEEYMLATGSRQDNKFPKDFI
jgi:hypothetical protein